MSPAEFLAHFDDVRPAGSDSWTAKAHSDQRTGSVAITHLPDGRWLVHDFAGTPTATLLADRGLQLADLFPTRRSGVPMTEAERKAMAERTRQARWQAAWNTVMAEAAIVEVAAREMAGGAVLDSADIDRLEQAAQRISDARVAITSMEQFDDAIHLGPRPGKFFEDTRLRHLELPIMRKEAA